MNKAITFKDIQTTDLIYYDSNMDIKNICYDFCDRRDIDFLPSIVGKEKDGEYKIFKLDRENRNFKKINIKEDQKISLNHNIFDLDVLTHFEKNKVLFVFDKIKNGSLSGIVHFSDYNNEVVSHFLYSYLHKFEKALREVLKIKNIDDSAIHEYFITQKNKCKDNSKEYRKYEYRIDEFNDNKDLNSSFQNYYIDDLIGILKAKKILASIDIDQIRSIRNDVMHIHNFVKKVDANSNSLKYDFNSFKNSLKKVLYFNKQFKTLLNYRNLITR
jgi:hypothetical protein